MCVVFFFGGSAGASKESSRAMFYFALRRFASLYSYLEFDFFMISNKAVWNHTFITSLSSKFGILPIGRRLFI